MIESEVIDVRVGEPHVTAEQIADVNIGSYGPEDYVLSTGKQMAAELITNNSVRVFDGVMVYGGIRDAVPVNKYYDLSIDNGSQGKNRNDIIVRRFTKEEGTSGKGTSAFAVVKGTAVSGTASDPAIPVTDIRGGALNHDMPLHRVRLEGLNIIAVEPLYKVLYNADEIQEKLTELNGNFKTLNAGGSAIGSSLKWRDIPSGQNLVMGCWATGLYKYPGYSPGAPDDYAGVMLTVENVGSANDYLKVAFTLMCSVYVMRQDSSGNITVPWMKT